MKTIFFTLMIMLIASFSQASFLPQTTPPSVPPVLKCNDAMIGIPEIKLHVQVYPGTQENPYTYVTVQKVDLNRGTTVLFSGSVTQKADGESTLFFGNGMNMRVLDNQNGSVKGSLAINNGSALKYFNVDCAVFYQAQPVLTAM